MKAAECANKSHYLGKNQRNCQQKDNVLATERQVFVDEEFFNGI